MTMSGAIKACFAKYADFEGRATLAEYWWFFLAVFLAIAIASVISRQLYALVGLASLLPLVAAGARRLHDTNRSGWWQLLALVPFGVFAVLILLAQRTQEPRP